jgi:hypothetical protein
MLFNAIAEEITALVNEWEPKLKSLPEAVLQEKQNSQNRTIKQIIGHMIDSASNNTHRVVQMQYRETPLRFHNYATYGNNDRWIAIQNYQDENREILVQHWKYSHLHFAHVIQNIQPEKLNNTWFAGAGEKISLRSMVEDFPGHFKLHLSEIEELLN